MSIEKVKQYFSQFQMADRVREFTTSSATVELAAKALGCEQQRIAKTMSFKTKEGCLLVVTSGDAKIDNAKYKAEFQVKASMLPPDQLPEQIGHPIGGVCPFAIHDGVPVYLDRSLKRFNTVFPACGSPNSAIELTIPELEQYSKCLKWVDVCKNWSDLET